MADQTHQSKKLEMLGVTDQIEDAAEETDNGEFKVRCPRCGFTKENLPRHKATALSHKSGCPECERPKNELAAGPEEDPKPLTKVGAPLAVSRMT